MKAHIRNLGAVTQAEIDLKPLTIFVGSNNTGKTWTAYALSAIFGAVWQNYGDAYVLGRISENYPPLQTTFQRITEEGTAQFNIVEFAVEYGETCINSVARLACRRLRGFLGTERVSFEDLKVRMELGKAKDRFLERVRAYSTEGRFGIGPRRQEAAVHVLKEKDDSIVHFYSTTEGATLLDKFPARALERWMVGSVFGAFREALYPHVYIFPTERTTYITLPFRSSMVDTLTVTTVTGNNEETLQQESGSLRTQRRLSPANIFLSDMETAAQIGKLEREKRAKDDLAVRAYIELSYRLEQEILDGEIEFSATTDSGVWQELLFQPLEGVTLDMPVTSSMVKELSPLALYLRYLAEPGDLFVIDEPEMNLHPEAQARLTEFLAMLVNAGLRVLFTTHSPYMVDHLINLMKAAEYENQEEIQDKFYLQDAQAFIPKEQVSVYLFEDNTATSILDEEGMIDWETFSSVSNRIAQIGFEL